jgi:23S rRNA (uracil1939-C5)-methyltransferase
MESISTNVVRQEDFEVTIERILPGGLGLAHADGRTVMVALAAPGDRVRVSIDRVKGNVAFALIQEIITPSPQRVQPPCQYFGRCGGCDSQQLTYQAQLEAKVEIIKDCLHRIGRIENVPDFQIAPAPNPWHYRRRAQWQYDSIRRRLGYFESGSRRVCDVEECAVLAPELQQTLSSLRERVLDGSLPEDARDFRAVAGNEGVSLAPPVRGSSPTVREGADPTADCAPVVEVTRTINGETYRLNAESFFQANDDLLPQLIDAAVGEAQGETAVELYCGVGLFTVPLARRFARVIGIEGDAAATRFARANLASANLKNAQVINQDVGAWLEEKSPPDFLLLDPPRTGAESRVVAGILNLKPKRISYVSCDPATLARDLRKLIAGGYTLESVAAFDMFPQTHHVETVAHLATA